MGSEMCIRDRAIIGPDTMTTRKRHDIFADQACEGLGVEGAAYDKRVDVYFQRNDWANSQFRMYRLTTSFSRTPLGAGGNVQRERLATSPGHPHRQRIDEFREYLHREGNTLNWF